jgi:translation initiation factor IF-2
MADNDDKRTEDTGAKKTLTLKGGPGLGNRPGMSRGPSRSTVVVEKRTRLVPKPNAPMNTPQRPPAGAQSNGRPTAGRPAPAARAPLGLSAAEAEARR